MPSLPTIAATVAIALLAASAVADTKSERETLAGLTGVRVSVDVDAAVDKRELSTEGLQQEVETILRRRGIAVLSEAEWAKTPGRPTLQAEISATPAAGDYVYAASVELEQDVRLVRQPSITTASATWAAPQRLGVVSIKNLATVRETVRALVDAFVDAYAAMNRSR